MNKRSCLSSRSFNGEDDKLKCLSLAIFASLVRCFRVRIGNCYFIILVKSYLSNICLDLKMGLLGTNALAYLPGASMKKTKQKLECLSLAVLSSLVRCFRVRLGACLFIILIKSSLSNICLDFKGFAGDKRSSLFARSLTKKTKHKLECLSLAILVSLVRCFRVRPRAYHYLAATKSFLSTICLV